MPIPPVGGIRARAPADSPRPAARLFVARGRVADLHLEAPRWSSGSLSSVNALANSSAGVEFETLGQPLLGALLLRKRGQLDG